MKITNVLYEEEDYLTDLEIKGSCTTDEADKLEKIAKSTSFFLRRFGKTVIDDRGFHRHGSLLAEVGIRYTGNLNGTVNFEVEYDGARINLFWKKFQKAFGQVDKSKMSY